MKKQKLISAQYFKKRAFLVAVFSIALLFSFSLPISAQSSLSLGKAPASEKLQLSPGEIHKGEIVIWSFAPTTVNYNVLVRGFRQIENQPGTAIMLTETEEERSLYSASSWISVSRDTLRLAPNKNEKIFYEINVPDDATKGEYYVIIAFISDAEFEEFATATFTNLSSGTPILIKVGEDFVEDAEIMYFRADKKLYEDPRTRFETRISNIGETHVSPIGEIVLTNMFNQEIATIPFNPGGQSVLRADLGDYETIWNYGSFLTNDKKFVLGPIDAKLVVTYRTFQPGFAPLIAETSFWILPWKYIVLTILIIITIVILLRIKKKRKKEPKPLPK